MQVEVLFFAAARERAGRGEETIELPAGATLTTLRQALVERHPRLDPLWAHLRLAVDEAFVRDAQTPLADGAVVALIPPVSGGSPMVALSHAPLDPRAVEALVAGPDRGAVVTFIGTVRDHTGDTAVTRLEYEAYESMALKVLAGIRDEARQKWPALRVAVHHRLGVLSIGEIAVVVAVSGAHRADTFTACSFVIERLKEDVPIFKREVRGDGSVWVGLGP